MIYDIICLLMVILAFAGGFQRGVVKVFGFLSAIIFGVICILWSAPYLSDFLNASMTQVPKWLLPVLLFLEFSLIAMTLFMLIPHRKQSKTKVYNGFLQNTMGGLFLSAFMVFSIGILSGFFEKTNVIREETRNSSVAYQMLNPLKQKSKQIWQRLTDQNDFLEKPEQVKSAGLGG
ncbi:MAG: hypothetical protein HKN76_03435 [Saprospiraceae bacterium]|nr:hypothetical protein [Saprospiraceae bacterium]